jgi:hypothetical protein
MVTAPGLQLVNQKCVDAPPLIVATGDLGSSAAQESATGIQVAFSVLIDGVMSPARTAQFPNPAATGATVPFRFAVPDQGGQGFICELDVSWAEPAPAP